MSVDLDRDVMVVLAIEPEGTRRTADWIAERVAQGLDIDGPGGPASRQLRRDVVSVLEGLQRQGHVHATVTAEGRVWEASPAGLEAFRLPSRPGAPADEGKGALAWADNEPARDLAELREQTCEALHAEARDAADRALREYIQALDDPRLTALFNAREGLREVRHAG